MVTRGRGKKPLFLQAFKLASSLYSCIHPFLTEKVIYSSRQKWGGGVSYFAKRHLHLSESRPCRRGNLQFTLHRPKLQPQKNCELTAWLKKKKKNQNPTLHFRPVNRTARAGEVFLCALRPPSWRKHQMSAPSRSSSLEAANREGSGRFPLSRPGYCPAAQQAAGEARLSGTAPPSSSHESPAPPERQKAQGKARRLRSKTGGPATSTNGSQTRIAAAATPTRLPLRDGE